MSLLIFEQQIFMVIFDFTYGYPLGGGTDDAKRKSLAYAKSQAGKAGNLAPRQGLIRALSILALNGPRLAVVGLHD